ncbi:TRAP transporter large permease subunit [bacterium]|nr:TRAP transporter large permease subunit [bacterium]
MKISINGIFKGSQNISTYIILFLISALPLTELLLRFFFKTGIYASALYIQHLVIWIAFVGGVIAARNNKHLSLAAGVNLLKDPYKQIVESVTTLITITVLTLLTFSSASFIFLGFEKAQKIGFLPIRLILLVIPISYAMMSYYFIKNLRGKWLPRIVILLGVLLGLILSYSSILKLISYIISSGGNWEASGKVLDLIYTFDDLLLPLFKALAVPMIIVIIASAFLGTPIFIVLAGITYSFFTLSSGAMEMIPNEAYTMLTGPAIPAIPLFTLAGITLSQSNAGKRLVRFFKAVFGWMTGGLAVVTIIICAFFTTFTGASGVTILALGGLLSFILINDNFKRPFTIGLLTSSGSIGLLFPPSLPIIMYGISARVSIKEMFIGGIIPGLLMVMSLIVMSMIYAKKQKVKRTKFELKEVFLSFKEAIWEILLPVFVLVFYFSGLTTLTETASLAVIYIMIIELFVKKDIKIRDMKTVFVKTIGMIGGILVILAVAKGLSYYIVDAHIPTKLSALLTTHIHSKYVFLLLLNIALLITGCLMDIFSAIIVVVPLIIPMAQAYGIDPIHLGVIFLANLELGYLTPPVGINLFLSSYSFNEPLVKVYRYVLPFLLLLIINVLLITYLPWLSTFLNSLLK